MTHDVPSATHRPRLDDLLSTMGITREQLTEMTADDLFAAAARWQETATVAAGAHSSPSPIDRLLDSLQGRSMGPAKLN